MRPARFRRGRRGVTLVETAMAVVVIGIVAAAIAPVLGNATDAFAAATAAREDAERCAFAIDRIVRVLRETPLDPDSGAGIVGVAPGIIGMIDGTILRYSGDRVLWQPAGGAEVVIATGVSDLQLRYFGEDGVSDASAAPTQIWIVEIDMTLGDVRLASRAWLRTSPGEGP